MMTFGILSQSSYLFSLVFPVSMTNTTSGIVTPVSAMFVDRTILKKYMQNAFGQL